MNVRHGYGFHVDRGGRVMRESGAPMVNVTLRKLVKGTREYDAAQEHIYKIRRDLGGYKGPPPERTMNVLNVLDFPTRKREHARFHAIVRRLLRVQWRSHR